MSTTGVDELSSLRLFIEEQQRWLHSVSDTLGWNQDRLVQGQPHLMQCPYNQHHFIAKTSVERHKLKCRYGVVGVVSDNDFEPDNKSSTVVNISPSIMAAVKKYAANSCESSLPTASAGQKPQRRDLIDQSDVVIESHDKVSNLESRVVTPQVILTQGPLHIIRYIKSWTSCIPADFLHVSSTEVNPVEVKAWLFTNLPDKHTFSSQLGGEIQAVEMAMKALSSHHSITPDSIVTQLTPVFGQQCQSFVLSLWKFIKTVAIQKQHTILDSVIEDLAPLPSSVVSFLTESSEVVADERVSVPDTLADKIQGIAAERDSRPSSPLPPLSMDSVSYILNTTERRILYDYVVEVGGTVSSSHSKDPSLFRDDAAIIRAKLKQQAREESDRKASEGEKGVSRELSLSQLKKERDYRRRRQKYRARNVHITRRTPAQVMHDIINARMLDISGGASSLTFDNSSSFQQNNDEKKQNDCDIVRERYQSGVEVVQDSASAQNLLGEDTAKHKEDRVDWRSSHRHREETNRGERSQRSRSREGRSERSRKYSQRSRSRERESRRRSRSPDRERKRKESHHKSKHRDSDSHHHKKKHREKKSSSQADKEDKTEAGKMEGGGGSHGKRHHHHSHREESKSDAWLIEHENS